jgi:hypothetical protein
MVKHEFLEARHFVSLEVTIYHLNRNKVQRPLGCICEVDVPPY